MYPGAMPQMMHYEGQGHYQQYVPIPHSQPIWENMRMPMPFFHIPGCNIPSHQNIHMMRSPFINQWTGGTQFQGQWGQGQYPKEIQGQWKQPSFNNQRMQRLPNKAQDPWQQPPFQSKGNNQLNSGWKQSGFNNIQGQWKQGNFQNNGQNQWQQATDLNLNPNVKMVGQWDTFPADDKMFQQPAVSDLIMKNTAPRV